MPDPAPRVEAVTLALFCAYCHGRVTLQFTDWPENAREAPSRPASWPCPSCRRENTSGFPGRFVGVLRGHEAEK